MSRVGLSDRVAQRRAPPPSLTPAQIAELRALLIDCGPEEGARRLAALSSEQLLVVLHAWPLWARPNQLGPTQGDTATWLEWLVLGGRGAGKTRTGAEFIVDQVMNRGKRVGALIGATSSDVRDTMLSYQNPHPDASGIFKVAPPWFYPRLEQSKRRIVWPNGAIHFLYSAEEPDRLRGPQHDHAWGDELIAWKYADTYDQLKMTLRLGESPQLCLTTTPRPLPVLLELLRRAKIPSERVGLSRSRTDDNVHNLSDQYRSVIAQYRGTRLGRQELDAEVLEDVPGALWTATQIDRLRAPMPEEWVRGAVGIDPAVSSVDEESDETGIVWGVLAPCTCAAAVARTGGAPELHAFICGDESGTHSPAVWGDLAIGIYATHELDRIVAEVNNGGDLVEQNLRTRPARGEIPAGTHVPYRKVHASTGKRTRAEPVSSLYEQGKVHHVRGAALGKLEDQLTKWQPLISKRSPDRLDALVWLVTELLLDPAASAGRYRGNRASRR